MNLKDNDLKAGGILTITSIVLLVGALGFTVFLRTGHGPSTKGLKKKANSNQVQIAGAIKKAEETKKRAKANLSKVVWQATPEAVSSKTLNDVASLTKKYKLNLVASRPLRRVDTPEMIQLPWQIVVEGAFQDVVGFERELEDPANRLAVNLFQLASGDATSDKVSATVGVIAFVDPDSTNATPNQPDAKSSPKSEPKSEPKSSAPKVNHG